MVTELIKSVLILVVSFLFKALFEYLGVPVDEATFNAIVLAVVSVLLSLAGIEGARARGFLK